MHVGHFPAETTESYDVTFIDR